MSRRRELLCEFCLEHGRREPANIAVSLRWLDEVDAPASNKVLCQDCADDFDMDDECEMEFCRLLTPGEKADDVWR